MLFLYQVYFGRVPPFVGIGVSVTEVPPHTGLALAIKVTLTGMDVPTVKVTGFDVEGLPVTQPKFETRTQVTTSLLAGM